MKKFAAIAVAASMFALAACNEEPVDPTPSVIDEPDQAPPSRDKRPCVIEGKRTSATHCP